MKMLFFILLLINPFSVYAKSYDASLAKCIDGDTARFIVNEKEIKARFLAIDTPETVHPTKELSQYGIDASTFTCEYLKKAQKIRLEYDDNSTEKDKYDRDLVWVFVDDVLLQDELVKNGYAEVKYLYGDYKYTSLLLDSQDIAKTSKIGIWSDYEEVNVSIFDEILNIIKYIYKSIIDELISIIKDMF